MRLRPGAQRRILRARHLHRNDRCQHRQHRERHICPGSRRTRRRVPQYLVPLHPGRRRHPHPRPHRHHHQLPPADLHREQPRHTQPGERVGRPRRRPCSDAHRRGRRGCQTDLHHPPRRRSRHRWRAGHRHRPHGGHHPRRTRRTGLSQPCRIRQCGHRHMDRAHQRWRGTTPRLRRCC